MPLMLKKLLKCFSVALGSTAIVMFVTVCEVEGTHYHSEESASQQGERDLRVHPQRHQRASAVITETV